MKSQATLAAIALVLCFIANDPGTGVQAANFGCWHGYCWAYCDGTSYIGKKPWCYTAEHDNMGYAQKRTCSDDDAGTACYSLNTCESSCSDI